MRTLSLRPAGGLSLTALLLLAFLVRCLYLGKSLGLDEIYSALVAGKDIPALISEVIHRDNHPPLYYLLLHFWIQVSADETWIRLLSVASGAALTGVAYLLGREAAGDRFGFVLGILTAFSSRSVVVSQLVRNYALQALLVNLSLLWLIRALQGHRAGDWVKHTVATILAVYTFYYSILVVLLNNATVLLFHRRRQVLRPWALSQVALLVCVALWLPAFFQQKAHVQASAGVDYQGATFSTEVKDHLYIFLTHLPGLSYHLVLPPVPIVKIVWPVLLSVLVMRFAVPFLRREGGVFYVCLTQVFGIFFLTLLLKHLKMIFVSANYFVYIIPWLFMVLLAGVFEAGKRSRWAYAGAAVVLVWNVAGVAQVYASPTEDFRGAAAYVDRMAGEEDLVCTVADFISQCYRFYSVRHLRVVGIPAEVPGATPGMTAHHRDMAGLLGGLFSGHRSVWMMYSHVTRGSIDRGKERVREILFREGFQVDRGASRRFDGVDVERFRR